jgi:hypothetical protein
MLRRLILGLVVLYFVVGCASVQLVTKDGIPLPEEALQIVNPETGLMVEAVFVRYYEESPESIYPSYLLFDKINYLSNSETKETTHVILYLRVWNDNKIPYKIIKYIRYSDEMDNYTRETMYEGKDPIKHFQLQVPVVEDKLIQIQADVVDEEGEVFFKLGYFDIKFGRKGGSVEEDNNS